MSVKRHSGKAAPGAAPTSAPARGSTGQQHSGTPAVAAAPAGKPRPATRSEVGWAAVKAARQDGEAVKQLRPHQVLPRLQECLPPGTLVPTGVTIEVAEDSFRQVGGEWCGMSSGRALVCSSDVL